MLYYQMDIMPIQCQMILNRMADTDPQHRRFIKPDLERDNLRGYDGVTLI